MGVEITYDGDDVFDCEGQYVMVGAADIDVYCGFVQHIDYARRVVILTDAKAISKPYYEDNELFKLACGELKFLKYKSVSSLIDRITILGVAEILHCSKEAMDRILEYNDHA